MASVCLGGSFGFPLDPSQLLRLQRRQQRQGRRRAGGQQSTGGAEGEAASSPAAASSSSGGEPAPSSCSNAASSSSGASSSSSSSSGHGSSSSSKGGGRGAHQPQQSPYAFLGPLAALAPFGPNGQVQCPPAIIKFRAAVAALKPVKDLRPQALPLRALGLMAATVVANVPCGMWRHHTKKFSPQWFLAVHITIPFIASLRKGVLMPPWAFFLTVAGAIGGQSVGARLERQRLARRRLAPAAAAHAGTLQQ